jgi:hypothetical protein
MLAPASNPRAVIGGNNPPEETAIDRAKPVVAELGRFLSDHPIIANEDEARAANVIGVRTASALKGVEEERTKKVKPLNEQVSAINSAYHRWHNLNASKPGSWDAPLKELRNRLSRYMAAEEAARQKAAEEARRLAEEAAQKVREAEEREKAACIDAAQGVCDLDVAAYAEEADQAFSEFKKADRNAQRADRHIPVRIGSGYGNRVTTLRNKETLTVIDWRAAIEEMGCGEGITQAILTAARNYRELSGELPAGIKSEKERRL